MRFLCLHGHGTNSAILEAQLDPIRGQLPSNWEFEFLDGEMDATPATGIDAVFPGPYLGYHGEPIPHEVQAAYDLVLDVVREEGPFDGVLGFSQGAAVASTLVLNHERTHPTEELFKVGVFLSTTMPFDMQAGQLRLSLDPVTDALRAEHRPAGGHVLDPDGCVDWRADVRSKGVIDEFEARRPRSARPGATTEPQSVDVLLRFHPTTHVQRLKIPTVHVIGSQDAYADHGRALADMCEPRLRQVITHDGGHQLPRDRAVVTKIAAAIQRAVEQMQFQT